MSPVSSEFQRVIDLLAKLPGLGPRSARRVALHLVKRKDAAMLPLAQALEEAASAIRTCTRCGNLDTHNPCAICADNRRDPAAICVVEEVGDLWALERAGVFKGSYHVLGGTLSALEGVGPSDLNIAPLVARASDGIVTEVILAVDATVDGQATAHYLTDQLENAGVKITHLAHGVPVGGELDYLDEGTLAAALKARRTL